MNLIVKINNINKTGLIQWNSFEIEDNINYQPNTLMFRVKVYGNQTYKPEINDAIEVLDQTEKIFAGTVISVKTESDAGVVSYLVTAKDFTWELDKVLVTDRYSNKTINQIIDEIVANYLPASGITTDHVNCSVEIATVAFASLPISKCLQQLAELVNFSWYIDYDEDIHFFAKNEEVAPFGLSDDLDNFIRDSLEVENDLSQLRNRVTIRGAEKVSNRTRAQEHTGDGIKKTFYTNYKYASKPTVTVGGVSQTIGVENIDSEGAFSCFWDYNQKYIRWLTPPTNGSAIVITGYPLIPIIVRVEDPVSISSYGVFEFKKVDKSIKSTEEARKYAEAQLSAYGNSVREGAFRTYQSGLKSGQTISMNLSSRGLNESFLIMRVNLKMLTATEGEWTIELATLRTMGIIDFLQSLLVGEDKKLELNEDEVLEKFYLDYQTANVHEEINNRDKISDHQQVQIEEDIAKDPFGEGVAPIFVLARYVPTGQDDPKREFKLDVSLLS